MSPIRLISHCLIEQIWTDVFICMNCLLTRTSSSGAWYSSFGCASNVEYRPFRHMYNDTILQFLGKSKCACMDKTIVNCYRHHIKKLYSLLVGHPQLALWWLLVYELNKQNSDWRTIDYWEVAAPKTTWSFWLPLILPIFEKMGQTWWLVPNWHAALKAGV